MKNFITRHNKTTKKLLFTTLLLAFSFFWVYQTNGQTFSLTGNKGQQKISGIRIDTIVWIANGQMINLRQARKGIKLPSKLYFVVTLQEKSIADLDRDELEFKISRYGFFSFTPFLADNSTKKILIKKMKPDTPPEQRPKLPKELIPIVRRFQNKNIIVWQVKNITPGTWQFKIESLNQDEGVLRYGKETSYELIVK